MFCVVAQKRQKYDDVLKVYYSRLQLYPSQYYNNCKRKRFLGISYSKGHLREPVQIIMR